ncbi:hypothetical protein NIES4102_12270 [Chondrocystis sp. NIES-4102]|nr:hypothetical protein NIES4102_12270 [Chondrocystis sp. NIES-4102]
MLNKFWLSILNLKPTTKANKQLELKMFISLDSFGWYAFGHHDPKHFIKIVAQKEPNNQLSAERVRWSWAIVNNNEIQEVSNLVSRAKAITVIEIYGVFGNQQINYEFAD